MASWYNNGKEINTSRKDSMSNKEIKTIREEFDSYSLFYKIKMINRIANLPAIQRELIDLLANDQTPYPVYRDIGL